MILPRVPSIRVVPCRKERVTVTDPFCSIAVMESFCNCGELLLLKCFFDVNMMMTEFKSLENYFNVLLGP